MKEFEKEAEAIVREDYFGCSHPNGAVACLHCGLCVNATKRVRQALREAKRKGMEEERKAWVDGLDKHACGCIHDHAHACGEYLDDAVRAFVRERIEKGEKDEEE